MLFVRSLKEFNIISFIIVTLPTSVIVNLSAAVHFISSRANSRAWGQWCDFFGKGQNKAEKGQKCTIIKLGKFLKKARSWMRLYHAWLSSKTIYSLDFNDIGVAFNTEIRILDSLFYLKLNYCAFLLPSPWTQNVNPGRFLNVLYTFNLRYVSR